MPFKTFTPSVLTAAEMNDYLMKQAVITCTSGTRPSSPVKGMTIYETDNDQYVTYNGSAWVNDLGGTWRTYTPTFSGMSLGNGTVKARYTVIGRTVNVALSVFAGATTTYSGTITIGLPTSTAAWYGSSDQIGTGAVHNGAGSTRRITLPTWASSTTFVQVLETTSGFVTNTTPFTFGTSAILVANLTYER